MLFEQAIFSFADPPLAPSAPEVRFSARARRLSLRVLRNARVEVVAPVRMHDSAGMRRIAAFVLQHAAWIEVQRDKAQRNLVDAGPFPPRDIQLPALAERWRIHLAGGDGRLRLRELPGGVLAVTGKVDDQALCAALCRWLTAHARPQIESQLCALATGSARAPVRLSLRRQRSRWGSCSARGTISLNLAMLFQRPEVARYLMIHELTHLEHPNHSARFWRAVEARCPDWRTFDRELSQGWRQVPHWLFS